MAKRDAGQYLGAMRRSWIGCAGVLLVAAYGSAGCGNGDSVDVSTSSSSGQANMPGAGGSGGSGGSEAAGGMGGAGGEGIGGQGGTPFVWPTCDDQPDGTTSKTINQIWGDDPAAPAPVWVPGVYVTAVSAGACNGGNGCQIFVQQQESFASIAAGSQQAIKLFASPATAQHFEGIAVGDQLDIYAHAWRYNVNGQNELLLQVASSLPGCAKVVGSGTPVPTPGLDLEDLTVDLYEQTMGPLLIQIDTVSGKSKMASEFFPMWEAFMPGGQPITEVTNLSPYMLPQSAYTGMTPDLIYNFSQVAGVFSLFVPSSAPVTKYEVLYPRTMADIPYGGQ